MRIEAIIFDMDDTLFNERDYVESGLKAVHLWVEKNHKIANFYETAMKMVQSGEKRFVFNKTLEALSLDYDENLIKQMVDQYRGHDPKIFLSKDAEWVLNQLNARVKIGLISDGFYFAQHKKVEALKLIEKFHSIILTDQWGRDYWKPNCFPYEQVSKELWVPHNQCVYVGDNVKKDFITAKKLGWTTVHINRKEGIYSDLSATEEYNAHFRIDDLRKLSHLPILSHLFKKKYEPN